MCAVTCCNNSLKITKALGKDVSYYNFLKETERLNIWIYGF